jgi:hypothetical protein
MSETGSGAEQAAQWWVGDRWQEIRPELLDPDQTPFALALNAEEFPALVQAIQFSDDIDGYLRSLGVSEESIRDDRPAIAGEMEES